MIARVCMLTLALAWPLQSLDDAARAAVQDLRRPGLERPMRKASDIGKPAVVFAALLAVAVFSGPAGPATAREVLLAAAGTNLSVEGLKRLTFRARPDGEHKRSNAAFPSSHAANAFVLAASLSRRFRRTAVPLWLGAAVIAFSRMYLDRHWLSDVLVGALLGVVFAWLAHRILARGRAEQGAVESRSATG
jgi:membrane-associated phospholipid phosphatase